MNRKDNRGSNKNDKRFCTNCQQDGHTNDQCFEKIGYPDWYKRRRNTKKKVRVAANVSSEFDKGMHHDTPFDMELENGIDQKVELDQMMVAAVCQEVMMMFKGKNVAQEVSTSYHASIKFCGYSYALSCNYSITMKFIWTIDIGASDHMSPHISLFCSIRVLVKPIKVDLPDEVTMVGNVKLTTNLTLYNVFYVPDFKFNLLSVGKLLNNQNMAALFFPN